MSAIAESGRLVEISLGSDDGIEAGRLLAIVREAKAVDAPERVEAPEGVAKKGLFMIGRLKVLKTAPDRSVGEGELILPDAKIEKGDRVITDIDLPK